MAVTLCFLPAMVKVNQDISSIWAPTESMPGAAVYSATKAVKTFSRWTAR